MKRFYILFASIAALMSCNNIDVEVQDEIRFNIGIDTKATSSSFESGDKLALYAVEYSTNDVPQLQIGGNFINNEKLTYDGSVWTSANKLYWSDKPCDFYALYPYQDLTSVDEHYFDIAVDQNATETQNMLGGYEASDIMYAKTENVAHDEGSVKLRFNHLMSKCVVTITKGERFEGEIPDDIVTHIYNTITSAKLNFAKGSVEKDALAARKTITMKKVSNERFEAIVVPQNIERRTPLIEITMGGIAYLLETSLSFKPGYVHTINLILNTSPDQEKIEISIDASVGEMN
jgi:hypothetical protein